MKEMNEAAKAENIPTDCYIMLVVCLQIAPQCSICWALPELHYNPDVHVCNLKSQIPGHLADTLHDHHDVEPIG